MAQNPTPASPSQPQQLPQSPQLATLLGSDAADKARASQLITALEQARGHRAIVYWMTPVARLAEGVIVSLYDQLRAIGKQPRLDLVLNTVGGAVEVPWPIVNLIREFCSSFSVLLPHRAHSAGTLLALGANEIVMTPLSILGPIDPSRTHHLLPTGKAEESSVEVSVQDMRHAMTFVKEAFGPGETYTPDAKARILTALFEKVHPLAIGAIEQSYALSKLIARRCLSTHMDEKKQAAEIARIADALCDEFKSHQYEINRREARQLGLKVVDAPADIENAMVELLKFYISRPVYPQSAAPPAVGSNITGVVAWLESTQLSMRVEADYVVVQGGQLKIAGDRWAQY
jgi:hypothetical protein